MLGETSIDLVGMEVLSETEDNSHTTVAPTGPLLGGRDPKGINKSLEVTFEDVIGEPRSVHSFDRVWLWGHALFEVSRLWFYRAISLLLAVPVSLVAGILFALLTCFHVWLNVPCLRLLLINMAWVQTVWASVLDIIISPFFSAMGKCYGAVSVHLTRH